MKKLITLIALITFTANAYSQATFNSSKYGSTLLECFYIMKISSSIPFSPDCQDNMKQKMFEMNVYLQTQLKENRSAVLNKIGPQDLKELETQLKNYNQYSGMVETTITAEQRQSMILWIALSKSSVEKIFMKFKKT